MECGHIDGEGLIFAFVEIICFLCGDVDCSDKRARGRNGSCGCDGAVRRYVNIRFLSLIRTVTMMVRCEE